MTRLAHIAALLDEARRELDAEILERRLVGLALDHVDAALEPDDVAGGVFFFDESPGRNPEEAQATEGTETS